MNYEALTGLLERHNILSDAAELHGIICGMLAGGMDMDNEKWTDSLSDFVNAGEPFPTEISKAISELYQQVCQQFSEGDFSLALCLPEDAAPIIERGQATIAWVQGFLLGFGVQQEEMKSCSEEVKEALKDFSEIVRMDYEMPEDEESEQALFEVMEYVRISAMLCFSEMGSHPKTEDSSLRTLH